MTLAPNRVRLEPGKRQELTIEFHPPRAPESSAAEYPLSLRVIGNAEQNQNESLAMSLTVSSFHTLANELRPNPVPAGRPARLLLDNQGNGPEQVSVTWRSEPDDLRFQPAQVSIDLTPGEQKGIEFCALVNRRRWFGGEQRHPFTSTIIYTQASKTQNGDVISRALMPLWAPALAVVLMALLFLLARFLLLQPPTIKLWADPPDPAAGQPVTIHWEGNRVRRLALEGLPDEATPIELTPANSGVYTIEQGLDETATIRLSAANFMGDPTVGEVKIFVGAGMPVVTAWNVSPMGIMSGESVTVTWQVTQAEDVKVFWRVDDELEAEAQPLASGNDGTEVVMPTGSERTLFTLYAANGDESADEPPFTVRYLKPAVAEFSVSATEIMQGEDVTVTWAVNNSNEVAVSWRSEDSQYADPHSLGRVSPAGSATIQLDNVGACIIKLQATNGDQAVEPTVDVLVQPRAPEILAFDVEPKEYVRWSEDSVRLRWETADTETIEIEVETTGSVEEELLASRWAIGEEDDNAPETDSIYRLVATGPGGVAIKEVSVTVRKPACTFWGRHPPERRAWRRLRSARNASCRNERGATGIAG